MTLTALDVVGRKTPLLRDVISGNSLGSPEILRPEDTVQKVSERMEKTGANALLVQDENWTLLGLVTARDIVRNIAQSGVAALTWPVEQIMTRNVVTDNEGTSCRDTLSQMFERRLRNIPVYDEDNRLVACVETLDVAKAKLAEVTESNRKLLDLLLRQNDERNTVHPEMDLPSLLQHMRGYELDHVVVHDGSRCLGYITPDEALRATYQASGTEPASEIDAS